MFLPAGFVLIATAILVWALTAIVRASAACGDAPAITRRLRAQFAVSAALWTGTALLAASSGLLRQWDRRPPPAAFMVVGILVMGLVLARSRVGDRLARGLPLASLVGLHAFRLPLELLMHQAATDGLMPTQMSYSGYNFDIVSGATALGLAVWLRMGHPPLALVWAWNIMGVLLLSTIVVISVLSTPLVAAFGNTPDRLNTFVASPPYVLLPSVMVLAAWAGHLVVFRALSNGPLKAKGARMRSD